MVNNNNNRKNLVKNKFHRPYAKILPANRNEYIEFSFGENWQKPSNFESLGAVERIIPRSKIRVRRKEYYD